MFCAPRDGLARTGWYTGEFWGSVGLANRPLGSRSPAA